MRGEYYFRKTLRLRIRRVILSLLCLTLLAGAQTASGGSRAGDIPTQQGQTVDVTEDVKRGIELYRQGDDKAAIELLRRVVKVRKDVVAAWHFLGLAYERQGKSKDARKAHEQATRAGEVMLEWLFITVSATKDADKIEEFKPLILLAAESADRYLKLSSKPSRSKVEEWNSRSETLRDYAVLSAKNTLGNTIGEIYKPSDVTTKAKILGRPEPVYTEQAKENLVSGVVVLRAVFAFDGKVRGIRVVSGLPYGLTLRAIEAARKIKFLPAMLNGQPVSQYIQIEYYFNLY
jgi:TonB family protein